MRQEFASTHFMSPDNIIGGGTSYAAGVTIGWHTPTLDSDVINGALPATVLTIVWDRLKFLEQHDTSDDWAMAAALVQAAIKALSQGQGVFAESQIEEEVEQ